MTRLVHIEVDSVSAAAQQRVVEATDLFALHLRLRPVSELWAILVEETRNQLINARYGVQNWL